MIEDNTGARLFIYRTGNPWGSLWLKGIQAVDLNQHCITSLVGPRVPVDPKVQHQRIDVPTHDPSVAAWYLCGVSYPYKWAENGHLVCVPAPGEQHEYEATGFDVVLEGLRPVPEALTEDFIDWGHPKAGDRLFNTCRNWRAACFAYSNLNVRDVRNPEAKFWARKNASKSKPNRLFNLFNLFNLF